MDQNVKVLEPGDVASYGDLAGKFGQQSNLLIGAENIGHAEPPTVDNIPLVPSESTEIVDTVTVAETDEDDDEEIEEEDEDLEDDDEDDEDEATALNYTLPDTLL